MPLCRFHNKMEVSPGSKVQEGCPLKFSDTLDTFLGFVGQKLPMSKIGPVFGIQRPGNLGNTATLTVCPSRLRVHASATP